VVASVAENGEVALGEIERHLSKRTKLVALAHVSNALGTVLPVREVSKAAHAYGAVVLVDGAQGAVHLPVDVEDMNCDFYAFSGHKVYGPTGIGILYGKRIWLEKMPPYQSGGEMIRSVAFSRTTYAEPPARFEAGTPNV